MNCFQLIKTVLDEAYDAIPGTEAEKDAAITKALSDLSKEYSKLKTAGCLDYSDPARRFAYLQRYTTAHANIVYSLLCDSGTAAPYFKQSKVSISAVGGGPGSDLLGALKFCEARRLTPELKCLLLDRDPAWGESWQDVDEKLADKLTLKTVFQPMDVTRADSYQVYQKHFLSDVFTLIYFMSEVYASRDKAAGYFDALFSKARPGALFIFVDNNNSSFYGWFDELAAKHGVTITEKAEGTYKLPVAEEKSDLGVYYKKFGDPKLSADIAYRIGVKK